MSLPAVNQGKQVQIAIGDASHTAGLIEIAGEAAAQLAAPVPVAALPVGGMIEADGREWIIDKVERSQFLRGFSVATLRPAEAA